MAQVLASSASEILTSQSFESPVPIEPRSSSETEIQESAPNEENLQRTPSLSSGSLFPSMIRSLSSSTTSSYRYRTKNSEVMIKVLVDSMRKCSLGINMKNFPIQYSFSEFVKELIKKKKGVKKAIKKHPELVQQKLEPLTEQKKEDEDKDEEEEEEEEYKDYGKYNTLRRAAVAEDWHVVKEFIRDHPESLTAELLDSSETILHYMVKSENINEFIRELVAKMPEEALELTDMRNMTALSYCAAYGNIEAAKIMVKKNPNSLNMQDAWDNLPIHHVARFGKEEMVHFLLPDNIDQSFWTSESGVKLVENLITANLYG